MLITLELTPELFNNLRVMVLAGGKSSDTGADGIMAAAQLLQIMAQAEQAARAAQQAQLNGAAEPVSAQDA